MTTDKLSSGMHHHVSTVLDRADEDWGEGIVNYKERIMAMCYLCEGIEIAYVGIRIAESFTIDHLGVRTDSSLHGSEIAEIHYGVFYALSGECVGDEIVTATVYIVRSYDVVTILQHILQGVSHSGSTRSNSQTSHTAFQSGNSVFEYALSGISQTTINIASIAQSEAVGSVLRVMNT